MGFKQFILGAQASFMGRRARALLAGGAICALLSLVSACGQKGPLYLPTDPAAANRATLPQTLTPGAQPAAGAASAPQNPASAPNPSNSPKQ